MQRPEGDGLEDQQVEGALQRSVGLAKVLS